MNDGNEILCLQDEKHQLRLLAAQRQLYADAKRIDAVSAVLCLGLPVAFTVLQLFVQLPFATVLSFELVLFAAGIALPHYSSKMVRNAAGIQQFFDSIVYGIDFPNVVDDSRLISHYSRRYLNFMNDRPDPYFDLRGWYTSSIFGMPPGEAVSSCQEENAAWTATLLNRYLVGAAVASVVIITALTLLILFSGIDPASLTFLFTVPEWLCFTLVRGRYTSKAAKKLSDDIPHYEIVNQKGLEKVQGDIFDYRASSLLVPDWFYDRFRDSDELAARDSASLK